MTLFFHIHLLLLPLLVSHLIGLWIFGRSHPYLSQLLQVSIISFFFVFFMLIMLVLEQLLVDLVWRIETSWKHLTEVWTFELIIFWFCFLMRLGWRFCGCRNCWFVDCVVVLAWWFRNLWRYWRFRICCFKAVIASLINGLVAGAQQLVFSFCLDFCWWKSASKIYFINGQFERIIDQIKHKPGLLLRQNRTHIRASIAFNEPDSQILVQNEIKAHDFELIASSPPGIKIRLGSQMTINHQIFHSLHNMTFIDICIFGPTLIKILQKRAIWNLIVRFVFLIVFWIHLETIVCQMDEFTAAI